jgi:hypothetical protein
MIPDMLHKLFGPNWKTTVAGIVSGAAAVATVYWPEYLPWVAGAGLFLNGILGKDGDVSGGKRS